MTRNATRLGAVFVVATLWLGLLAAPTAAASTIRYVDDDGTQCPTATYTGIQLAIDEANPGDRIFVCPGRYPEQLTLNKNVLVRAWPLFKAHIDVPGVLASPDGTIAAVRLTADNAKLRGFRIHVDCGTNIIIFPLLPLCTHVDVAILVLGQDNVVRNNKIDVTGDDTLSGHCGYDYGIVVGQHAPTFAPTGVGTAISATARVTFNWVRDFKRGGILVEEADSYALVRRNDIRYYHLNDAGCDIPLANASFGPAGFPCLPNARPSGDVNSAFPSTFGIGVESGAEADIIVNAVASGLNAGEGGPFSSLPAGGPVAPTPLLSHGISLTALDETESNLVHRNAISRTRMGIHTDSGADGAEISYNHVTTSFAGFEVFGSGDEFHHNHSEFNEYGIAVLAGDNNIHDNVFNDNDVYDCLDDTTGTGTDGTDNTWTSNTGATDSPDGICDPET